jgi:hypothetical protein
MTDKEEQFVRTVIARQTIAALASMHDDWSAEDSRRSFDEYIALCREAHRAGAPLPPMFRTQREAAS